MRSVEDHLTLVTAAAVAPRPVRVAISEAQGLMCAEEVVVERPMPGFDQAAIDGYAVRAVDVALAGQLAPGDLDDFDHGGAEFVDLEAGEPLIVGLPVVGDVSPGARTPTRLQPRQA
nr:molybdopterin molybdenumtransferase [Gordonia sp. (in: high G+C Gram-positive bacteria)]